MSSKTGTQTQAQALPPRAQLERQRFLCTELKQAATAELAQRGISAYELIVKVDLGVVDADNISNLPEFYADHEADDATTIADLKRQLKLREQANAKLKRVNVTLSATNKELVSRLRDVQEGPSFDEASVADEITAEKDCVSSDQATDDADTTADHKVQDQPPLDSSDSDDLEPALKSDTSGQQSEDEEDEEVEEDEEDEDSGMESKDDHGTSSPQGSVPGSTSATQPLTVIDPADRAQADLTPTSFQPTGRIRCAFMAASANKTMAPIGDPFQVMDGWATDMEVDVSQHGTP